MLLTPLGCTAESRSLYRRNNRKTGGPAIVMLFETDLYDPIFWLIPVCLVDWEVPAIHAGQAWLNSLWSTDRYWWSIQDRHGQLRDTGNPRVTDMAHPYLFGQLTGTSNPDRTLWQAWLIEKYWQSMQDRLGPSLPLWSTDTSDRYQQSRQDTLTGMVDWEVLAIHAGQAWSITTSLVNWH